MVCRCRSAILVTRGPPICTRRSAQTHRRSRTERSKERILRILLLLLRIYYYGNQPTSTRQASTKTYLRIQRGNFDVEVLRSGGCARASRAGEISGSRPRIQVRDTRYEGGGIPRRFRLDSLDLTLRSLSLSPRPPCRAAIAKDGPPTLDGAPSSLYEMFKNSVAKYGNNRCLGARTGPNGEYEWST